MRKIHDTVYHQEEMGENTADKISVIIPCYNVEKYIDRCLTSVVNQTIGLDRLEIICVNDASTDGTWEKLLVWEQQYSEKIVLINSEENGKPGKARNIGLSYASGKYIVFVDSDDWLELDIYEKMYRVMCSFNCDIVRCQIIRDAGKENIWESRKKREKEDFFLEITEEEERKKFLVSDIMDVACYNKMFTRDFIFRHQIHFPEGCTYEDIYWGILCYLYAERIYFLNEKLYHYFVNTESIVLKKDGTYHMDIFSSVMLLWEECVRRGAIEQYPREMELNFLIYYYLGGLKMLALRFSDLKFEEFQKMCEVVRKTVPEYKTNPYLTQVLDEMKQLEIALIDKDISKDEFARVVNLLRDKTD